ncbi:TetR/AcrR family transcriptional regulator [Bacillaceae bacterium SIJ1]|nr:TetR/AcrR family transcriptional regulator [Litoribacterium kuwaitense]
MAPKVSDDYKRKRKEALLQAAKTVFMKKGYARTSMQDIMDEAEISRGAFYGYFNNIAHVFLEVLQKEDARDLQCFTPSMLEPIWPQLKKWIAELRVRVDALDDTLLFAQAEFFLTSTYVQNKAAYPYITERYQRMARTIAAAIREGEKRGECKPQLHADAIAHFMMSFVDGFLLDTFQYGVDKTKVDEQFTAFLFSLEQMLKPKIEKE